MAKESPLCSDGFVYIVLKKYDLRQKVAVRQDGY
jgi:hypothetical protein